jgi:hypothetical protein
MVLEKAHEEKILEAIRKAAQPVEYGEVQIKLNAAKDILDIVVITQERIRLDRTEK